MFPVFTVTACHYFYDKFLSLIVFLWNLTSLRGSANVHQLAIMLYYMANVPRFMFARQRTNDVAAFYRDEGRTL